MHSFRVLFYMRGTHPKKFQKVEKLFCKTLRVWFDFREGGLKSLFFVAGEFEFMFSYYCLEPEASQKIDKSAKYMGDYVLSLLVTLLPDRI